MTKIQKIQGILKVDQDDIWGPISQAALNREIAKGKRILIFKETKAKVKNRGIPPDSFLQELVNWGKIASDDIFAFNDEPADVFNHLKETFGPQTKIKARKAIMLEIMRVLAGFESTWDWNEGMDTTNPTSNTDETRETGAWQVSYNSRVFGADLRALLHKKGITNGKQFQIQMKKDHMLAMEYIARLLRHTVNHNGPVKRHEIDQWLSSKAAAEFHDSI